MARFLKSRHKTHGKASGSLIFIGEQKMEKASIRLIKYNKDNYSTMELSEIGEVYSFLDDLKVNQYSINTLRVNH